MSLRLINSIHAGYVLGRRARVLCDHLAALLPEGCDVVDVGCGDGQIAAELMRRRPDLTITGLDVLVRDSAAIAVQAFDGSRLPYADQSRDVVLFVDVLHHTSDPAVLLAEAARVARRAVIIKDHTKTGFLAGPTLRFMDFVGNSRYGVALPYNYWPRDRWERTWRELGLMVAEERIALGLYPIWANWIFGRSLHFIARLTPTSVPGPANESLVKDQPR